MNKLLRDNFDHDWIIVKRLMCPLSDIYANIALLDYSNCVFMLQIRLSQKHKQEFN
jgi:hypothetical protein